MFVIIDIDTYIIMQIQQAKQLKMATKILKWLLQSLSKIGQNSPMSTLKFNLEAALFKDCVCLQCFQQDALEFDEIIVFIKPEMTSKMIVIALTCNSFCLKLLIEFNIHRKYNSKWSTKSQK